MSWYYAKNKVQLGPVDKTELDRLVSAGEITPDTLVWQKGMAAWVPYSQALSPAAAAVSDGPDAVCAECGQTFDKSTMIRHGNAFICSSCKPAFLQKLSEGVSVNTGLTHYGGFWIRLVAKFVDGIIIGVPVTILMFAILLPMGAFNPDARENTAAVIVQLLFQLFSMVLGAAYSIFFVGKYGATPGKMLFNLKIVDATGTSISYGRATGRFFAEILSGLICYIGYIMAAFDPEKQALHDRICNTRVVYKK
jgi:uncharacterized RDD family membrane protein YckC